MRNSTKNLEESKSDGRFFKLPFFFNMKIKEILKTLIDGLKDIEFTDPFIESRRIIKEVTNLSTSDIILKEEMELEVEMEKQILSILERRKKGEPLQYILGYEEFYGERILLNKNVLIPRPDTEISVENILKRLKENGSFLELGVGSGAVICTVARLRPFALLKGVDISYYALECTRKNIENLGLKNVEVKFSDLFSEVEGKFDIIYSNPPYIKSDEIDRLQVEIRNHEPRLALDGGEDGLVFYRRILKEYKKYLNNDGYLILEIGHDEKYFFSDKDALILDDLNGLPRVVIMR